MERMTTPAGRQGNIAAVRRPLNCRFTPNNSELTTLEESRPDQDGSAATAPASGPRGAEGVEHSPAQAPQEAQGSRNRVECPMMFLKKDKLIAGAQPAVTCHSHPLSAEAICIVAATAQQPQAGLWRPLSHGLRWWWQPAGLP